MVHKQMSLTCLSRPVSLMPRSKSKMTCAKLETETALIKSAPSCGFPCLVIEAARRRSRASIVHFWTHTHSWSSMSESVFDGMFDGCCCCYCDSTLHRLSTTLILRKLYMLKYVPAWIFRHTTHCINLRAFARSARVAMVCVCLCVCGKL